ncbi:MAG TPA: SH3-like domain-containing protein, partial [Caulobacteraceae bacterium]|nr:SH3-like domain-containing protein [Caulobacteraceae bacterium]
AGLISEAEAASGRPDPGARRAEPPLKPAGVEPMLSAGSSYVREGPAPRFAAGDTVRARVMNPVGHTRLPRYVRGREGVVTRLHGAHVFPDSNAHFHGEAPQPLYTVRFAARELWGPDAGRRDAVYLDLWEPYLEPA